MGSMFKWVLFLSSFALFATEELVLEREDGSNLIVFVDPPEQENYSIAILIPGSQQESSLQLHNSLKSEFGKICPITLEKRGIGKEKEFQNYLSFDERIKDHQLLYNNLQKNFPKWDRKLMILGQGDGGRIGALFAASVEKVEKLALIASGGAWDPMDELLYSFRSQMAKEGFSPKYIQGFLVQAKEELNRTQKNANQELFAFNYSYKYWASFLKIHLGQILYQLKCPILSINGVLDDRIPIESVEPLAQWSQITLIRKEKKGREILKDPKIYSEAISWLSENF